MKGQSNENIYIILLTYCWPDLSFWFPTERIVNQPILRWIFTILLMWKHEMLSEKKENNNNRKHLVYTTSSEF